MGEFDRAIVELDARPEDRGSAAAFVVEPAAAADGWIAAASTTAHMPETIRHHGMVNLWLLPIPNMLDTVAPFGELIDSGRYGRRNS